MKIHTARHGETVNDVAALYGADKESIMINNELRTPILTEGQELLILIPTRTYTVKSGDTPEKISMRFGVKIKDLYALNPLLSRKGLAPGDTIILKCAERTHGMAVGNGYFYNGCTIEKLKRALPYLTYVTFASAINDDRGIHKLFDDSEAVKFATESEKLPVVRIYNKRKENYSKERNAVLCEKIIEYTKDNGYKGIALPTGEYGDKKMDFSAFIMELRKRMIGNDLILLTELDENSPPEFCEYADASIISYPKYALNDIKSFDDGEIQVFSNFAATAESAKTFIDIPALAKGINSYICIQDAIDIARNSGYGIKVDEDTLISEFSTRKNEKYQYTSLKNIKAVFNLLYEYGYMGICFDIMRTPLSHLMMYNSMFKTSSYTSVRSREGCSRDPEW